MTVFRPNVLLHIEDDREYAELTSICLMRDANIRNVYGKMKFIRPLIIGETVGEAVQEELGRIEREMQNASSYVHIATAQVARGYLSRHLPAALISDTSFPMNGKAIVGWLNENGFPDYPLIGLSGTPISKLDPKLRDWFASSNAIYLEKGLRDSDAKLIPQIVFNTEFNRRTYGNLK